MTATPDLVHGAWVRRWAAICDGEAFETQHVIWLQAGTCYADIRVPFHPGGSERCFTGWSGWDGDRYRWTHHVDLESVAGMAAPTADDIGDLAWESDALIERGDFPTPDGPVPYVEGWARLPGACGAYLALESPTGSLIQVGDHAITARDARSEGGEFTAIYRRLGPGGWADVMQIGDGAALPGPVTPPPWDVVQRGFTEVLA